MNENQLLTQLVPQIVDLVVDSVNLHHIDRTGIGPQTVLMQGGLGLDSVDVLEVVVAVEQKFGVKVKDAETGKTYFQTIGSIAQFVQSKGQSNGQPKAVPH